MVGLISLVVSNCKGFLLEFMWVYILWLGKILGGFRGGSLCGIRIKLFLVPRILLVQWNFVVRE